MADAKQPMPADRDLVVAMAAGDSEALRSLNARYGRMLAALARRFLSNESDAEEVVADVLWQAWREAKTFDAARGSVSVWLVTLARSRAIDRLRANRARKPPSGEQPASEPVSDPAVDSIRPSAQVSSAPRSPDSIPTSARHCNWLIFPTCRNRRWRKNWEFPWAR